MKKNYLYLILLLLSNLLVVGQKVTLTPTTVNGASVSTGPINLGSTTISKITLATEVTLSAPKSNTDPGNIKIYYQKNSTSSSIITNGGEGGSLLFNGGTSATRSFDITLNLSDFDLTGGYIYAEYKTSIGSYKSTTISVIKNATTPSTPPTFPKETLIEAVPYGTSPLLPEFIDYPIEYYSGVQSQYWYDGYQDNIPISTYNMNTSPGYILSQKTIFKDGSSATIKGNFVKVRYLNFFSDYENLSVDNRINSDQYLTNGQPSQTIIGNQASETHGPYRRTTTTVLTNYQWQTRISFPMTWYIFNNDYLYIYGWKDISGATEANYTPPKTSKGMEYRRLVIEPGTSSSPDFRRSAASNIVKILPITIDPTKNTICCDQLISSSTENVKPIIGDREINSPSYQWQISQDEINWEDIIDAKKKDYTPVLIDTRNSRYSDTRTQYYRRIINKLPTDSWYISNTIKINFKNNSPRTSIPTNTIKIYPNPTSSILNIEDLDEGLAGAKVNIVNITGNIVIPNSYSIVSSNLITMNVSNLSVGTYYINIETYLRNRRHTRQITFIKQ